MATDTFPTGSSDSNPARGARGGRVIEYQQYIDAQLGRTRRRVKWVDLWAGMALLAAGVIGYFLLAAVVDHWVIPGGLGTTGRWLLLIGLLAGVAVHLFGVVVPFLLRKVNPVYAAAAIEQGGPMKNTLINFLLLRKEPTVMPDGVLDAMKEQAAVRLSTVPGDASVDRSALLRWCYVLAAVLIGALGYAMVSPKDSFRSIRRVISPWAELAAPTRVRIESVDPGDAQRRRDDVVTVTMRVAGVRESDAVVLFYSASGNPADDVPLPMQSDHNRYLWKVALPPGSEGLKQDLFYYIQAGDAATPRYRIKVLATPVINVRAVRFDYPAYTGLPPRTIERQGDLKALEGTRVTITAEANQPIRAAHVAFDTARNKDVELKAEGLAAVGAFDLALLKDRITPGHTSYVLRFANVDGEENPKPTEYKIEVTADQPPEVRIVEPNTPADKELSLPLGSFLRVTAAARDPDFQLGELTVVLRKAGALLREEKLLAEPRYGEFSNTLVLNAERYNLRVGEKFTFRVRAADNKSPQPNIVETKDYTVVVVPGSGGQPPPDQQGNPQNQPPQPNQGQPNQGQPQQNPNNGEGQNGNPGDRPQSGDQPQGNQPPNGQQPNGNPKPGEQRAPNNGAQPQPPAGNNSGDAKNGGEGQPQPSGPQQPGEPSKNDGPKNGADQKPGDNSQPGEQKPGEQRPSGNQPNENPQQGNQSGDQKQNGGQNSPEQKRPDEPIDPNVDPGKAFDELQKHFEQQEKKNDPKASADQPPSQPDNGAQPNQKNDGQQGGSQPNGSQKSGGQENGGGKNSGESRNNAQRGQQQPGNEQNGSGSQSGAAQPQQGADGNKSGNEQKPGGSAGTGQSQSNAPPGDQPGTGGPRNQPSQKSGEQNAQPGGDSGQPTGDGAKPNGERRPGENNAGGDAKQPPGDGASKSPSGNQPQTGNNNTGENETGKPSAGQQPGDGSKPGETAKPNDGAKPGEALKPGESAQPGVEQRPGAKPNDGQPGVPRESNPANSGNGAQSGGDSSKPEGKNPRAGEQPIDPQTGKPSVNEQNPAGAQKNPGGQEGQASDGAATPNQQERAKPRNQTGGQEAGGQPESSKEEGKTPSNSKTESDAQGGQSGDRSAKNGESGGGQKSQQSGTGAAGQSQAGEQGGGVSGQEGNSATSNQGGDQVRSGDPTQGKPSQQPGTGTKSNNPGEQPGGEGSSKSGEAASGDSNNPPQQNANPSSGDAAGGNQRGLPSKQDGAPPQTGNQNSSGGNVPNGEAGDVDRGVRNNNTSAPPADPANLDYAQKVTDLTLERLKQQLDKGQVDPELLKRFKSREALEEFARRWDSMRQNAKEPGPNGDAARKQFQENLKSLGLRPGTTTQQGSTAAGDTFGSGRGGKRSEPPAKYADQYRAYTTGVGQSEK